MIIIAIEIILVVWIVYERFRMIEIIIPIGADSTTDATRNTAKQVNSLIVFVYLQ